MFGLILHPRRSDDGRPVAMRLVAGQSSAATTDAPSPVIVDRVAAPMVEGLQPKPPLGPRANTANGSRSRASRSFESGPKSEMGR